MGQSLYIEHSSLSSKWKTGYPCVVSGDESVLEYIAAAGTACAFFPSFAATEASRTFPLSRVVISRCPSSPRNCSSEIWIEENLSTALLPRLQHWDRRQQRVPQMQLLQMAVMWPSPVSKCNRFLTQTHP